MSVSYKTKMPWSARIGIALLIFGAVLVGLGNYQNRGVLSVYGLIIVFCGFFLYFITSIFVKRNKLT